MKQTFLHVSDLHYRPNWEEETGRVLTKFFNDVNSQKAKYGDLTLVFSGDLVHSASDTEQHKGFLKTISEGFDSVGIPQSRRICVPGNHDVARSSLKKSVRSARGSLEALKSEEAFLDELSALTANQFEAKFAPYVATEKAFAKYGCCQENVGGSGWALDDSTGVFCLNTALCSFGGLEDPDSGTALIDKAMLSIDSRTLHKWDQGTDFKTRILVMHHPLEWLSDWSKNELEKLISEKFRIVFSGHVHAADAVFNWRGSGSSVFCRAPALFTRKNDLLGYAFVTIDTQSDQVSVDYRQWTGSKFVAGVNFANNESGSVTFVSMTSEPSEAPTIQKQNGGNTDSILEAEFVEASTSYSSKRQLWIDRDLSKHPEATSNQNSNETVSISSLIERPVSYLIRAPREFGLSCLGKRIALDYFRLGGGKIYIVGDASHIGPHRHGVTEYFQRRCADLKCSRANLTGIILDNWQNASKGLKLIKALREEFGDLPIILLHGYEDFNDLRNPAVITEEDGFEVLYLNSLSRARIRGIVCLYLEAANSTLDADIVTKKLIEDIDALNTHRTPLSCLLLLKLIERHFEESPVNRTEVIKKVLVALFHEFDQIPKYSSRPDLTDCEFALGYLCEWMLKNDRHSFRREEYFDKTHEYCRNQMITFDSDVLFNFLCSENIFIRRGIEFGFRHAYWRFYFTALRMHHSAEFAVFILSESRYTAFPEVIEFYTGIDRQRTDAVRQLTADLRQMDAEFLFRTQIAPDFNPLADAKWNPDENSVSRMHREVTEGIQESALPSEVKDAVADGSYDRSKPYHQEVNQWIKTSSLDQMIQAMKAAARALRNSDHVAPNDKRELLGAVVTAWTRLCQILVVLSPILATNRKASFEGMGFVLADGFEQHTDPEEVWKEVMTAIADNVVSWHQLDLFSKKLGPLFNDYLEKNKHTIGELLLLLVIAKQRPPGWKEALDSFISSAHKNSFYLNRVYCTLRHELKYGFSSEATRQQQRLLAAKAVAKHSTKVKNPNQALIAKAARLIDEELSRGQDA
jgi:predicted MPP superfamily phosphohydrolase